MAELSMSDLRVEARKFGIPMPPGITKVELARRVAVCAVPPAASSSAPSISTATVTGIDNRNGVGRPFSYSMEDLLGFCKLMHEKHGLKALVDMEENTIHCFSVKSQADRCTTLCQPLSLIKDFLVASSRVTVAASFRDQASAEDFASGRKAYDLGDYVDYIKQSSAIIDDGVGEKFQ